MKRKSTILVIALAIATAFPPRAEAVLLGLFDGYVGLINQAAGDQGWGEGAQKIIGAIFIGAWAGALILGLTGAGTIAVALDNPDDLAGPMSQRIQSFGASETEAKNLAALFVNAQKDNRAIIPGDEVSAAAPVFAKTQGFANLVNEMAQAK